MRACVSVCLSKVGKLDQVYCAWLIKWAVKRKNIQLAELCLLRWWIINGTGSVVSICRAHICHEYHELYTWRKNCHVEKFGLFIKNLYKLSKFMSFLFQIYVEKNLRGEICVEKKWQIWGLSIWRYWLVLGQYKLVLLGIRWHRVSLYILEKLEIWSGVTDAWHRQTDNRI